jgi:hypothetical protein
MRYNTIRILFVAMMAIMMAFSAVAAPSGADLTPGASSRGTNPSVVTAEAQAGNVTQLDIDQTRITDIWQGFYGNVAGEIVLENSAGDNFYNWSYVDMQGQIYASRLTIADWSGVACSSSAQISTEETALDIPATATDGINETFRFLNHTGFDVGAVPITANTCPSTRPYNSTGQAGDFYNLLLNSDATNIVYTAVLANNADGFDGTTVDFEILVPTDRSTGLATYYFYVELR